MHEEVQPLLLSRDCMCNKGSRPLLTVVDSSQGWSKGLQHFSLEEDMRHQCQAARLNDNILVKSAGRGSVLCSDVDDVEQKPLSIRVFNGVI